MYKLNPCHALNQLEEKQLHFDQQFFARSTLRSGMHLIVLYDAIPIVRNYSMPLHIT